MFLFSVVFLCLISMLFHFRPKSWKRFNYYCFTDDFLFVLLTPGFRPGLLYLSLSGKKENQCIAQSFPPFGVPADRQEPGKGAYYSSLIASIGLILIALFAGIRPAMIPATTSTANAESAIVRFISGFRKNNLSPPRSNI